MDEDEKVLDAVINGMGEAARGFKARRWAPKPKPEPAPVAEEPAEPQLSAADLEGLLATEH